MWIVTSSAAVLCVAVAAVAGCGSSDGSDPAPTQAVAPTQPPPPTFGALYRDVIQPSGCTAGFCHGGARVANLDMETEDRAYAALVRVSVSSLGCDIAVRVEPGDPEASLLWRKVAPGVAACGPKMPAGTAGLPAADAERVRVWIDGGALR